MNDSNMNQDVRAEFAKIKKRQYIATPIFLLFLVPMVLARRMEDFTLFNLSRDTVFWISLGGVIIGLFFSFFNWRCPICSKYLGREANPAFCQKCGAKLREA